MPEARWCCLSAATAPVDSGSDESSSSDPLNAERRKTNQLEKEIRILWQQLNRFSDINLVLLFSQRVDQRC